MLSLLNLDYQSITVDITRDQQRQPTFLQINPLGQIPVLQIKTEQGIEIICDSIAILCYLAKRFQPQWYPEAAVSCAQVQRWLAIANKELALRPAAARRAKLFRQPIDQEPLIQQSHHLLQTVEQHLQQRQNSQQNWIATEQTSIADIAMYTYIAIAPEGGVQLDKYPAIRHWLQQVESLPGFVAMPSSASLMNK